MANDTIRTVVLVVYYVGIMAAVIALHGRAETPVATYIYQDF